ncbi:MAG: Hint domain-containing protein, partial [Pseudomonadota bacterium]
MTLIITELAIQANGTMAVEIFNTGSVAVDTTVTFVSLQTVNGGNGPIAAFDPAVIPPGGVLTVGHSSIPGLDQNPSDSVFASTPFQSLILVQDSVVDNLGQVGGTNLGTDVVYEGLTSRAPDPDFNSNNLGDFSQTSGFSNNSLGTAVCFATGTQIATPDGSIAVEDLVIGDLIRNAEGGAMPVRWIGLQTLVKRFAGDAARLVRVAAGALGAEQDLYLTADHGLVLDGYVVNASALV